MKKSLIIMCALITSTLSSAQEPKSLGSLEFSEEGILFAGDNTAGAIFAFDFTAESESKEAFEINVYGIDEQVASILGTTKDNVGIQDIAVHPKSREVYLSVARGHGLDALPALLKVDANNQIKNLDLSNVEYTSQALNSVPDRNKNIVLRGSGGPPTKKEIAKSKVSLRTLTIVNMEYHNGELFIAGISNEDFNSVLRRLPYPFPGKESISNIELYHIAHDSYETRAPIRAMVVKKIDGIDQLVAAYTCSPLVLIPLSDLQDGAKVKAKTIGDMGNGQPIDMVSYNSMGQEMIFVTNNSRSPMFIPVQGLNGAKVVTEKDFDRGSKLDFGSIIPYGPVGKPIMFTGASLRIDLLNEKHFVSLNRDIETGSLDLESLGTLLPIKMHNIVGEKDIPNLSKK
jgi:hypothetical protein